jgi:hypothetical protein
MRTVKSAAFIGRPESRFALPSYFSAINLRWHHGRVSGVTMVATSAKYAPSQLLMIHPAGDGEQQQPEWI